MLGGDGDRQQCGSFLLLCSVLLMTFLSGTTEAATLVLSSTSFSIAEGGSADVTISVSQPPPSGESAAVLASVSPRDGGRPSLSQPLFEFDDTNYNIDQTLTITINDNQIQDASNAYSVRLILVISSNNGDDVKDTQTLTVTAVDNDIGEDSSSFPYSFLHFSSVVMKIVTPPLLSHRSWYRLPEWRKDLDFGGGWSLS